MVEKDTTFEGDADSSSVDPMTVGVLAAIADALIRRGGAKMRPKQEMFGERVASVRKGYRLTRVQFGTLIGVSEETVKSWETRYRQSAAPSPGAELLVELAAEDPFAACRRVWKLSEELTPPAETTHAAALVRAL